nr:RHS repeat-associated core domain-containing protein [Pseudidiomarina sediminum]
MVEGNGTLTSLTQGAPFTPRGFTGHEHIDSAKLIHMNGRGYDYQLGRFLSVDPFIQAPANSQSHNPYSYIMNNPLAGTDPSGYLWCGAGSLEKAACGNEQKQKRRDAGSVGHRAAETIWINGGPAVTNGARHSPRSAATGEQEREAIGGPGEGGTSGESTLIAAGQAVADSLGNSSQIALTVAEGCSGIKCRAEIYYGYQAALDMTGKCDGCVWFGVAGDMASLLYKGYDMIPGDFIGNGGWSTDSFMNSTNAFLFPHNTDNYLSLMRGGGISGLEGISGKSLDVALVGFEQRLVQGQLDKFKSSNFSGYNSMISGLNDRFRFARQYNLGIPELNKVSHALNKSFGSKSFDFGNESHRVSLGIALAKERY